VKQDTVNKKAQGTGGGGGSETEFENIQALVPDPQATLTDTRTAYDNAVELKKRIKRSIRDKRPPRDTCRC